VLLVAGSIATAGAAPALADRPPVGASLVWSGGWNPAAAEPRALRPQPTTDTFALRVELPPGADAITITAIEVAYQTSGSVTWGLGAPVLPPPTITTASGAGAVTLGAHDIVLREPIGFKLAKADLRPE
jgi:hypothetical protein